MSSEAMVKPKAGHVPRHDGQRITTSDICRRFWPKWFYHALKDFFSESLPRFRWNWLRKFSMRTDPPQSCRGGRENHSRGGWRRTSGRRCAGRRRPETAMGRTLIVITSWCSKSPFDERKTLLLLCITMFFMYYWVGWTYPFALVDSGWLALGLHFLTSSPQSAFLLYECVIT